MGFTKNPFSTYSAEEEITFLSNVYVKPKFFNTIKSDLLNGHTRFILGARGIGKTALLLQLKDALEHENVFTLIIDNFDGVNAINNSIDFISLIIREIVTQFCILSTRNPKLIKKLSTPQKEKLSYILTGFFKPLTDNEYTKYLSKIDAHKSSNTLKKIFNKLLNKPINVVISGGLSIISDAIRQSLGLPTVDSTFYKNYIPNLEIKEDKPMSDNFDYKSLKLILEDLTKIVTISGYKRVVIFFDKIDEYISLGNNLISVANFLKDILKDTTVLMNNNYSLVFSIWNAIRQDLANTGVRFDKIKPIDITWNSEDLKNILKKRVQYFSNSKKKLGNIIPQDSDMDSIIELSNSSPRFLLRLLSYIYDYQDNLDNTSKELTTKAISVGEESYCRNFDFYAMYPTKKGTKEDVVTNVNRLLKIGKRTIGTKDFANSFKISTQTAISYIKIVQGYSLIKELPETTNGAKLYEITDPVIKYLLSNNITALDKQ